MGDRHGIALAIVLLAAAVAGCGETIVSMSGGMPAGDPIAMPARPDEATCTQILREEPGIAAQGRQSLGSTVPATLEAARAAADDPAADVFTFGIPLTQTELADLRAAGVTPTADMPFSIRYEGLGLTYSGPDDRTGAVVIATDESDREALAQLRCLEITSAQGTVTYLTSAPSEPTLQRELERIRADLGALRSAGLPVSDIWLYRECHCVQVEIKPFSDSAGQTLIDRYGGIIVVASDNGVPGH